MVKSGASENVSRHYGKSPFFCCPQALFLGESETLAHRTGRYFLGAAVAAVGNSRVHLSPFALRTLLYWGRQNLEGVNSVQSW